MAARVRPTCSTSLMDWAITPRLEPSFSMSCRGGMQQFVHALRLASQAQCRIPARRGCVKQQGTLSTYTSLVEWNISSSVLRLSSRLIPRFGAIFAAALAQLVPDWGLQLNTRAGRMKQRPDYSRS